MRKIEAEILDRKIMGLMEYYQGFCNALNLSKEQKQPLLDKFLSLSNWGYRQVSIEELND